MQTFEQFQENHEDEFLKDTKNGRFVLSIGGKGQGKSYLLCAFLKHVLFHNVYKYVHFVCPCYKGEQNNSYDFLKTQKHVLIYPHYNEEVSKRVDRDRKKGKTLFLVDDATGELLKQIDNTFIRLITTARHHEGMTMWVCVHSAKRILLPVVRQNIDHLFMYKIINLKLLQDIYDEYFSMLFNNFNEFKVAYNELMKEKHSCMHFSIHMNGIDTNVKNWSMITSQEYQLKPTTDNHTKPKKKEDERSSTQFRLLFKKYRKY